MYLYAWRHVPLRVQGPAFSSQQQVFFVGSIQPTTEGFTAEFNSLADEGEKEFQMLLEKQGTCLVANRAKSKNQCNASHTDDIQCI